MAKIGLQMYSVRDIAEKNFLGTIERVAEMGYDGVQFAGFYGFSAKEVRKVLDKNGIVPAGSHTSLDLLVSDEFGRTLEFNDEIGNRLIICPWVPEELRKNEEDYKRLAEALNLVGEKCVQNGFEFAYHNHDFEFDKHGAASGFDIIFNETSPSFVKMELDCYWVNFAGFDPMKMIAHYGNRVISLHMKDVKEVGGRKRSIEIGKGELDMGGLVGAGKNAGVNWFIVEQEEFDGDPLVSSAENVLALKSIYKNV